MQKGKKNIKIFLNSFSSVVSIKILIYLTGQKTILPFYHAVSDDDILHIKNLYNVRKFSRFKMDIEYLLKYYKPISINELSSIYLKKDKNKYMFLSFDDGLRQIYDFIAPFLLQKGIPAHFFINSAFVDNKDLMFRYKVSLIIEKLNKISNPQVDLKIKKEIESIGIINSNINNALLNLKYSNVETINNIANLINLDFKEYLKSYKPYMSVKHLDELVRKGFTIGAHSVDHPEYRYLNLDEQISQTENSIKYINDIFNLNIKSFAFPFTDFNVCNEYFNKINQHKLIDISFGGAGLKKMENDFHFQRIPIEDYSGKIRKIIHTEYLYYLLKMPFGKNLIKRK